MGRYISLDPIILKETREPLGHTQESLAHAVGIARETYTRIEKEGRTKVVTAEKIADQLAVDLDHLTGTKRQDTLFSPFACEWRYRGATGHEHKRLLFNTEWELLEFIESHIADERPALDDNLFPEFSKKSVPDYSAAPDGTKAELELPLRGRTQGSSEGFHRFIFRELEYRETQGFVWCDLTKWAQRTIEDGLKDVLNRYSPEYRFNGQRLGADAEFYIILVEGLERSPSQSLTLQDLHMLIQFSKWLAPRLPKSAFQPQSSSAGIELIFFEGPSGMVKIFIQRRERDGGTLAPFPDDWQEQVLRQLEFVEPQKTEGSKLEILPNIEDFSDQIPELQAIGEEMRKRNKKLFKN